MLTSSPALLHTTQLVSLTTSIFLSGINFGASHLFAPVIHHLDAQTTAPAALAAFYHGSARIVLPFAILSTAAAALTAAQSSGRERTNWIIVAVATFASLPWTRIIMKETSKPTTSLRWAATDGDDEEKTALHVDESPSHGGDSDEEAVRKQLRRWRRLSLIRSTLALVGGLVAAITVVYHG
ncbi:hypothetical protein BJ166DRAFT_269946 [Pestalotiopsis sp. NC0098]|nr:hypothetical protein BJ166DRAFT_269946 [Pestalotiopsis sp. NC0098]